MRGQLMKRTYLLLLIVSLFFLLCPINGLASTAQEPEAPAPPMQRNPDSDPIQELRLTSEQRQQIRAIRQEMQDERASVNQRLREANRALQEALESDNPDEISIQQKARDLAEAQAAQIRLRVLSEVRIRRVLTPEQRALLRELRQNRQFARDRAFEQRRRRDLLTNPRRLPGQRNGLGPTMPLNDNSNRARP
jgi:Spy/CpxP family protein refolding chaperone